MMLHSIKALSTATITSLSIKSSKLIREWTYCIRMKTRLRRKVLLWLLAVKKEKVFSRTSITYNNNSLWVTVRPFSLLCNKEKYDLFLLIPYRFPFPMRKDTSRRVMTKTINILVQVPMVHQSMNVPSKLEVVSSLVANLLLEMIPEVKLNYLLMNMRKTMRTRLDPVPVVTTLSTAWSTFRKDRLYHSPR